MQPSYIETTLMQLSAKDVQKKQFAPHVFLLTKMMMMAVMTLIHNVHGHSVWELGNKVRDRH